ncbi:MAG: PEP-CTERM sorting domain-containing protein [Planctomycetota bacterium]
MSLTKQDFLETLERTKSLGKKAAAYTAAAAVVSTTGVANADFTGDYTPGNWTVSTMSGDAGVTNDGLTAILTGTDSGIADVLEYSVTVSQTGTLDFDWDYTNLLGDYGSYDYAGFIVDNNFTLLATNADDPASGTESIAVNSGQSFSFIVASLDGEFGPGQLTISNFEASPIPEPSALGLLAAGTIGGILASRRRK